jgi:hypothetical protein
MGRNGRPGVCVPGRRFFEDYKKNEHKDVKVDDILGAAEAMKCVKDSLNMYQVQRRAAVNNSSAACMRCSFL